MRRSLLSYPVLSTVLFILYSGFAVFGLQIHPIGDFATLVWVPSGLSLAFLFIFGLKYWPAVMAAAFTANLYNDATFPAAVGISIGNTLEPVVGAYILKRFVKLEPRLERVDHVLGLIFFAALFSTLISATGGVTSLWLNDIIKLSEYGSTWLAWWAGDAVSILVVTPLLLVWSTRPSSKINPRQLPELALLVVSLFTVILAVFDRLSIQFSTGAPRSYLVFPFLVWAALRFGPRISISAVFLLAVVAVWNTTYGFGPFVTETPSDGLLDLQMYMAVASATTMILAAAISEQKIYEQKKDEFISVASHELKTPITSIKTFTQTLQLLFERKGDEQSSAHMIRMNRQIDRLNRLVVKLLDLTRIQEGRIFLQKERFSIGSLIKEIADEVSDMTHHKIVISGDTKVNIIADRDRIGRVLTNLLTNAAKYSPRADEIIVKVKKQTDSLTISVRDFGIGISKDNQDRIFDRFYQAVNKKPGSRDDSLGLGLYIAKSIVERHGGQIWVKSARGSKSKKGSTFCFSLPLKPSRKK